MSCFQTLPLLVIEKIFSYAVNSRRKNANTLKTTICPLLWLYRSLRHVALQYTLSDYGIVVTSDRAEKGLCTWPVDLDLPVSSIDLWVKSLYVTVLFPLANFPASQPKSSKISFTTVRSLNVCIIHQPFDLLQQEEAEPNIPNLVQYLQDIAPNVRDLEVLVKGYGDSLYDSNYQILYTNLATSLIRQFAKRKLVMHCSYMLDLNIGTIADRVNEITRLDIPGNGIFEVAELVPRFTSTLRVLKISGYGAENVIFSMLKNEITGDYIVYPRMKYLNIAFEPDIHYSGPYQTFPTVVPFPNLESLKTSNGYPFGDDILFRGSQHSLRSVDIMLTRKLAANLTENHTFTGPIPYRYLAKVRVYALNGGTKEEDCNYLQLLTDIGRFARALQFDSYFHLHEEIAETSISQFSSLQTLQDLDIRFIGLTLANVVELVQRLPNLTNLQCAPRLMDKIPNSLSPLNYLKHLVSSHYPLSQHLSMFCLNAIDHSLKGKFVISVLFLAILCPNLEQIALDLSQPLDQFMTKWNKMLGQKMYKEYAERLRLITIKRYG